MPSTRWLVLSKTLADSAGPRARNSPPIDQEEMTPSEASRNGRRTAGGTLGRWGLSRRPEGAATGSGIRRAPAKAIAKRTSSTA